jgi:hypothetical protein
MRCNVSLLGGMSHTHARKRSPHKQIAEIRSGALALVFVGHAERQLVEDMVVALASSLT